MEAFLLSAGRVVNFTAFSSLAAALLGWINEAVEEWKEIGVATAAILYKLQ